ncbi:GRAM domain-containing protein 1B-like isoform X1 [Clarias magur]|uniref:GRAM domain-containing protein 1B-like isoform X1 n=1 Tax=Clarias magur TaxID=1594786 RepID=A0A8J4XDH2_CLAMG|nr:GRAM domain-containing protein 1B-like isoform X1 [Clarias magur]
MCYSESCFVRRLPHDLHRTPQHRGSVNGRKPVRCFGRHALQPDWTRSGGLLSRAPSDWRRRHCLRLTPPLRRADWSERVSVPDYESAIGPGLRQSKRRAETPNERHRWRQALELLSMTDTLRPPSLLVQEPRDDPSSAWSSSSTPTLRRRRLKMRRTKKAPSEQMENGSLRRLASKEYLQLPSIEITPSSDEDAPWSNCSTPSASPRRKRFLIRKWLKNKLGHN